MGSLLSMRAFEKVVDEGGFEPVCMRIHGAPAVGS